MICNKYILVISLISFINLYALIQFIKKEFIIKYTSNIYRQ